MSIKEMTHKYQREYKLLMGRPISYKDAEVKVVEYIQGQRGMTEEEMAARQVEQYKYALELREINRSARARPFDMFDGLFVNLI